jgi:hypothetical protein
MTDVNTIASRYIDLWNERTPGRRRDILSQHWAKDAKYVDPLMSGEGHDGVDALIAGVQQRFSQEPKAWAGKAIVLERDGLPRVDPVMGGRYWPAVFAWWNTRGSGEWLRRPQESRKGFGIWTPAPAAYPKLTTPARSLTIFVRLPATVRHRQL